MSPHYAQKRSLRFELTRRIVIWKSLREPWYMLAVDEFQAAGAFLRQKEKRGHIRPRLQMMDRSLARHQTKPLLFTVLALEGAHVLALARIKHGNSLRVFLGFAERRQPKHLLVLRFVG